MDLGTNYSEILIEIYIFALKKKHLKMFFWKWQSFCLGLNSQCVSLYTAWVVVFTAILHPSMYGNGWPWNRTCWHIMQSHHQAQSFVELSFEYIACRILSLWCVSIHTIAFYVIYMDVRNRIAHVHLLIAGIPELPFKFITKPKNCFISQIIKFNYIFLRWGRYQESSNTSKLNIKDITDNVRSDTLRAHIYSQEPWLKYVIVRIYGAW